LGVNHQTELTVLKHLASKAWVPTVYFANHTYLVSEYIEGENLKTTVDKNTQQEISNILNELQKIEIADLNQFSYGNNCELFCQRIARDYLSQTTVNYILNLGSQIDNQDWLPVLCHHDLIAENIILNGKGIYIIDWEYAGMGHPQFDYLRIFNNQQKKSLAVNDFDPKLQTYQALMDQLWYAVRYPELQSDLQSKLNDIIETEQIEL
jgi:thiamine kinase-like enzyme